MTTHTREQHCPIHRLIAIFLAGAMPVASGATPGETAGAARSQAPPGTAGTPYPRMPAIAPIGVRVDKYLDIPEAAKGAPNDPAKGYRTQKLGNGLFMGTDGSYQSMFMSYENGVVVVDAPPSYAAHLPAAIAEASGSIE